MSARMAPVHLHDPEFEACPDGSLLVRAAQVASTLREPRLPLPRLTNSRGSHLKSNNVSRRYVLFRGQRTRRFLWRVARQCQRQIKFRQKKSSARKISKGTQSGITYFFGRSCQNDPSV
jgi:hypothetical protein